MERFKINQKARLVYEKPYSSKPTAVSRSEECTIQNAREMQDDIYSSPYVIYDVITKNGELVNGIYCDEYSQTVTTAEEVFNTLLREITSADSKLAALIQFIYANEKSAIELIKDMPLEEQEKFREKLSSATPTLTYQKLHK